VPGVARARRPSECSESAAARSRQHRSARLWLLLWRKLRLLLLLLLLLLQGLKLLLVVVLLLLLLLLFLLLLLCWQSLRGRRDIRRWAAFVL
jgi:hypothetical protein